jgi:hypothetical protein
MITRMRAGAVLVAVVAGLMAGAGTGAADQARQAQCDRGEFCLWARESYRGPIQRVGLDTANPGACIPLPAGFEARSFANRTTRPVTVYQGGECSTEGEFDTYPGGGTFVPVAPYLVRGVQIWES